MREVNFPGKENMIALWNGRPEGQREGEKCCLCPAENADYFLAHLDPVFPPLRCAGCRGLWRGKAQSSGASGITFGVLHSTRGFHSHVRGELAENPLFFREKPKNYPGCQACVINRWLQVKPSSAHSGSLSSTPSAFLTQMSHWKSPVWPHFCSSSGALLSSTI